MTGIETANGKVTGVVTVGGTRIAADVVVANSDAMRVHELLGTPKPRRPLKPSMSAFLLYLGTDKRFEKLGHHTLLVGDGYRDFIRDVTGGKQLPRNFSTYVHAPNRTEAGMAVSGGDSLCFLLPVPNLRSGTDWAAEADKLRDRYVKDLEETFGLTGLAPPSGSSTA